jgi:hypothetical protein
MAMLGLGLVLRVEGDLDSARSTFEAGLRISRQTGDNQILATAWLCLACVTGDAGDWDRAATLHGIAQAIADRWAVRGKNRSRYRQDSLDQAHARLGEDQLERAYAHGMALSLDQALDLALRRPDPA